MKFVAILFFILLFCTILAMAYGYWIERPVSLAQPVTVAIAAGDGTSQIAEMLADSGLIRSKSVFKLIARLRSIDRNLRPGRYRFEGAIRVSEVLDQLRDGRAVVVTITIPEGWTLEQIVESVSPALGFSTDSIVAIAENPATLAEWTNGANSLEGYLHPETYYFYWGVEPHLVLNELLGKARQLYDASMQARADSLGWNRHQVLTMASLIEAEAAEGTERALISGVFHNRLSEGWLLQCDPTVVYAMGGLPPGGSLTTSDLKYDSPYNTYVYPGLPPGPICNPGRASILAALYPADTEKMYFVATGKGTHVFSRTLDEHNRAVAEARRDGR